MSKTRLIQVGLAAIVGAFVWAAIPHSEGYSSFGFGLAGRVDVECGSVFSRDQRVDFRNSQEQAAYNQDKVILGEPAIFEGETETEVCDSLLRNQRIISIVVGIAGGAMLLVGLAKSGDTAHPAAMGASSPTRSSGDRRPPQTSQPNRQPSPPTRSNGAGTPGSQPVARVDDAAAPDLSSPAPPDRQATEIAREDSAAPPDPVVSAHAAAAPTDALVPEPPSASAESAGANHVIVPASVAAAGRAPQTPPFVLLTADEGIVDLDQVVVVGRNPTVPDHIRDAVPIRLVDETLSVSKTHAAFGIEGDEVWVEDLHSSNGSELLEPADRDPVRLEPGLRRFVNAGQNVRLGDHVVRVQRKEVTEWAGN